MEENNETNNMEPISLNEQTKIEPKEDIPKKKGNGFIIVLLILIILGMAGYIYYDKFMKTDSSVIEKETKKEEEKPEEKEIVKEKLLTGKKLEDFKNDTCFSTEQLGGFVVEEGACGPIYEKTIFTTNNEAIVEKYDVYMFFIKENFLYLFKDNSILKINNNGEIENKIDIKNVVHIFDSAATIIEDNIVKLYLIDDQKTINLGKIDDGFEYRKLPSRYYDKQDVVDQYKPGYYLVFEDTKTPYDQMEKLEDGATPLNAYEYYYIPDTGETGKIKTYSGGYAKPVLYLYPTQDNTNVTVSFEKPELLTTTYPKYNKVWNVTANKNGDLYDSKGNYYYGLYWEESKAIKVDFKEGFYVTKDNAIDFLEEKLTRIGLNPKERNEFIMYWLPILEKNEKNLVYFELTESREANNKLNITPKPDSLLRFAIHIKKVNKKVNIKEEYIPTFNRTGFTVVEWGGTIVK